MVAPRGDWGRSCGGTGGGIFGSEADPVGIWLAERSRSFAAACFSDSVMMIVLSAEVMVGFSMPAGWLAVRLGSAGVPAGEESFGISRVGGSRSSITLRSAGAGGFSEPGSVF